MNKNKLFEKVGKLTFSIVLTGALVTGIVLAGTTWQTYDDNDIVSGTQWQSMVTAIQSKVSRSELPTCQSDEALTYNGSVFSCVTFGASTPSSTYPGCDTADIMIGTSTIAACNVGTNTSGLSSASYGGLFQWGNNDDFSNGIIYTPNIAGPLSGPIKNTFITANTTYPFDWITPSNSNLWGDTTNTNVARQGPCANGYHVPSSDEWQNVIIAGGYSDGNTLSTDLQLPLAGGRKSLPAVIGGKGVWGKYWTSSPDGSFPQSRYLEFNSTNIQLTHMMRSVAYSVRCFKN